MMEEWDEIHLIKSNITQGGDQVPHPSILNVSSSLGDEADTALSESSSGLALPILQKFDTYYAPESCPTIAKMYEEKKF